jgi:hypothetical protein
MALNKKDENKVSARVFSCLSLLVGVVLLGVGLCAWKMGSGVVSTINKGIVDEKIYFPPADNPAFAAEDYPAVQKYAGEQVKDTDMAKAFANVYIGVTMNLVGGGKTSSEVGVLAAADPQNPMLQQQAAAMFQLGTSKALLLNASGAGMQAKMIQNAGMILLLAGVVLLVVSAVQFGRYKKS